MRRSNTTVLSATALALCAAPVVVHKQELVKQEPLKSESGDPPRRLSNEIGHPDYRPDFMRVGLKINGEERHDVNRYDCDTLRYDSIRVRDMLATSIEPYWRYPETRQLRRARERWERQHGKNR